MKKSGAPRCIDNTFQVIKLFNDNSSVTSKMIAEVLAISRRSAQRYIADISAHLGIVQNEDGSYSYMDVSKVDSGFFTNDEKILMYTLIENGRAFMPQEKHATLAKLERHFMLESASEKVVAINETSIDYNIVAERIKLLDDAIKYKNKVSFHYSRSRNEHTVSPLKIVHYNGYWYLYSISKDMPRVFRIDYIDNLKDEPEKIDHVPLKLIEQLAGIRSIWGTGAKNISADILLYPEIADFFLNRKVFADMTIVSDSPCVIRVNVAHYMELFEKIAKFTPYYEVLNEPLRSVFYETFSEALENHKNKSDTHDAE